MELLSSTRSVAELPASFVALRSNPSILIPRLGDPLRLLPQLLLCSIRAPLGPTDRLAVPFPLLVRMIEARFQMTNLTT